MGPGIRIALVLAVFGALIISLRSYRRLRSPDSEWVRKLLHMAMGLVALCAPWLFATNWPVILLTTGLALFLTALRVSQPLKRFFGDLFNSAERRSVGDLCFPISVGLLFLLSRGDLVLFCIPVLILTFPDSAAALLGRFYGRHKYRSLGEEKSLEGSVAFLATSFLSVYIPLSVFTETGRLEAFLISMTLSLLLALLEGISPRGLDNLLLPLSGYFLLKAYLLLDVERLAAQLSGALVLIVLFALYYLRNSTLHRKRSIQHYAAWKNSYRPHGGFLL